MVSPYSVVRFSLEPILEPECICIHQHQSAPSLGPAGIHWTQTHYTHTHLVHHLFPFFSIAATAPPPPPPSQPQMDKGQLQKRIRPINREIVPFSGD